MDDFNAGTTSVDLDTVKMKLSYRDILLLLGILVAMIIGLTTLVYQESTSYGQETSAPQKKNLNGAPVVTAKKLVEKASWLLILR